MNPAYQLKGITNLNHYSFSMNLERNIVSFFDYGCLLASGYQNIYFNSTDYRGNEIGKLKPAISYQYSSGKVWEAYRSNWVWESGSGITPVAITGVYVNGVFSGSGFDVNYKNGQIVFNTGIPTSSTVKCSYSPKTINWLSSDSTWFRELVAETYNYDAFDDVGIGSGIRSVINNHRVQLPAVVVEVSTENNFEPYQLGGGHWYNPKVFFHVFAETPDQKKLIKDIISSQNQHSFLGVDFNKIAASGDFPMNSYGFLNSGAKTFPDLYNNYPWNVKPITFENLNGKDIPFVPNIYRCLVIGNCNLVLYSV